MDYTLYQLLWFFLIYAFLGWLMETALAAVRKRRLLNRGFLNAPFSPVYGLAAVLFAIFLPELRSAPFFLFLGGMILATGLELSTGLLLERISHQKWWDYSDEPWNFNGHICLKYSLVWGLLALLCVFFLNPLLVTLTGLLPRSVGKWILLAVLILLGLDFLGSWAALLQLKGSLGDPPLEASVRRPGQRGDPLHPAPHGPGLPQPGAGTAPPGAAGRPGRPGRAPPRLCCRVRVL